MLIIPSGLSTKNPQSFRSVLIRMFVVGTGVPDGPQNTNFGRDIVFSADLCYNEITS